jgi:hypothetical protein
MLVEAANAQWIAYNDCLREAADSTAANVTGWTIHSSDLAHATGRLQNYQTGSEVGMPTVTFTMGPAGLQVSSGGAGGNPAPGTDAYEVFHNVIDFGPNTLYYGSPGWWVEIEFTTLDPAKRYTFVGTAIRSSSYPARKSLFTILGHVSATNNSSAGVVSKTANTTILLAGDNSAPGAGYVVRWDDITPVADGSFTIRAEATADSDGGRAYPLGGFMLQEVGAAGNRPPEVDAGDYPSLSWPNDTLQLSPVIYDDDPCSMGILTLKWSQLSGPGTVTFQPSDNIPDPCAVFSRPGDYQLQLQVWDDVPQQGTGTVTINIIEPLLGDLNGNKKVNWDDLVLFAVRWLDSEASSADINFKDGVNMIDFAFLAKNWLAGTGATLLINELMARNDLTVRDPQGDYDDWIEIYNAGDEPINVGGMYLTDDASIATLWRIPDINPSATTIPAGGYLLIWADNDTSAPGLHAAFELDADGGDYLALFDTDGRTMLDSVTFGKQTSDVSYGREPDGIDNWVTLAPTPGSSNNGSYLAVVADTKFSHDRGFYDSPFSVAITTETGGAAIRYTTDGSTPTETYGTVYTAPIPISETTCLRAAAFKPACKSTNVDTHTYIFLNDVIRQATDPITGAQVTPPGCPTSWGSVTGDYQMDPDVVGQNGKDKFGGLYAGTIKQDLKSVPTISLVMNKDDWFGSRGIYINQSQDGTERVASVEFIDPNTEEQFQLNSALAMQGGVSGGGTSLDRWKTFKLSMRPRFKTQTDDGKLTGGPGELNFKLFPDSPVDRHNTVVLDAVLNHSWLHSGQHTEVMYIQDQYVADLHNTMGGHSPHGFYAHVYITGLYWGMYYIHERPDHAWAAEMFGGDKDSYDAIKHNTGNVVNDGGGPNSGTARASFNAMVNAATAVSSDPTNLAKYNTLREKLDTDNFITYVLANWLPGNHDWPGKNWYATHRHPDGLWRFHSWDAEHTVEFTNQFGQSPSGIHDKLRYNPEYQMRFADIVHKHFFNSGTMSYPSTANLYRARMNQIDRAIVGESARWGDNRSQTPHTRQDWVNTQNGKLGRFVNRSNEVLGWLKGANLYPNTNAPVFYINGSYQHGGHIQPTDLLSITAPSGTTWYTLDGSDPRLPAGAVNTGHATVYATPMKLAQSTRVKARVLSGSTWSALNEATFAVGPVAENLRITEIMYHPADTDSPSDANEEFIELRNIGSETINLNLTRFTNGIDFTFSSIELSAGKYVLLVKDQAAFYARYPEFAGLIAGQYSGSLANDGERIRLEDAIGQTILDFKYSDAWREITDGQGFSLTIVNPANPDPNSWGEKDSWRASAFYGGSPGWDDTGIIPEPGSVVINEVLAHAHADASDWIELHNTTSQAINIGGWFLSDTDSDLTKYQIADGTAIPGGGYIVLYQDQNFGNPADPGCHTAFALSENGDQVYLSSAEGGVLTGYQELEDFDASETGVAFGRYYKGSTDNYNFVAMSENTPGAANAYPKVGPIVINEIMYNPGSGNQNEEYIELHNITPEPVTLYRYDKSEPWRFTDGIEFVFPSDPVVTIPAGGYLLLVKDLAAFAARYGDAPAGVQVLGPYDGQLQNGGEKLDLSMPGDVDEFGTRYYIRIDRVSYSDGSHPEDCPGGVDLWPVEADGSGMSLSRKVPGDYGNDVANWQGAAASPGRPNP